MAWRRLLGDDLWARHLEPPTDEREIARHFTLIRDDVDLIATKRTDATRLGFALLLLYLRSPGRVLEAGEVPPDAVLAYVARQLGVSASVFDDYAARDTTRREHLAELMRASGYSAFSRATAIEMVGFLATPAQTIVRPGQLAGILVEELRRRRVLLPSALVLEAVIRGAKARAERLAHEVLTARLCCKKLGIHNMRSFGRRVLPYILRPELFLQQSPFTHVDLQLRSASGIAGHALLKQRPFVDLFILSPKRGCGPIRR